MLVLDATAWHPLLTSPEDINSIVLPTSMHGAGHGESKQDTEMADCQAPEEEFQTVFLGTGAACPSKYRNVTSIYLDFYERGGLLLDCGEASLGQLIRYEHSSFMERKAYVDIYCLLSQLRSEPQVTPSPAPLCCCCRTGEFNINTNRGPRYTRKGQCKDIDIIFPLQWHHSSSVECFWSLGASFPLQKEVSADNAKCLHTRLACMQAVWCRGG